MAVAIYGPLVESLRGSVGGTCFQRHRRGHVVRLKTKQTHGCRPREWFERQRFADIVSTWRTLSDAVREQWKATAAEGRSGFNSYVHANMRCDVGIAPFTLDPFGSSAESPTCEPAVCYDGGNLWLVGGSRILLEGEVLSGVVLQECSETLAFSPTLVHGRFSYLWFSFLPLGQGAGLDLMTDAFGMQNSATFPASNEISAEMWFKPLGRGYGDPSVLMDGGDFQLRLIGLGPFTLQFHTAGGDIPLGPVIGGVWHYVVFKNRVAGPNLSAVSLDGILFQSVGYAGPPSAPFWSFMGDISGAEFNTHGRLSFVRVRPVMLSDGDVAYEWNGGSGRALVEYGDEYLSCPMILGWPGSCADYSARGQPMKGPPESVQTSGLNAANLYQVGDFRLTKRIVEVRTHVTGTRAMPSAESAVRISR